MDALTYKSQSLNNQMDLPAQQNIRCVASVSSFLKSHSGSMNNGSVHAGSRVASVGSSGYPASVHGSSVYAGSVHTGSVHTASVHGSSVHTGSLHGSSVHEESVHTGSVHGSSVHGGSVTGSSVHNCSIHNAVGSFHVMPEEDTDDDIRSHEKPYAAQLSGGLPIGSLHSDPRSHFNDVSQSSEPGSLHNGAGSFRAITRDNSGLSSHQKSHALSMQSIERVSSSQDELENRDYLVIEQARSTSKDSQRQHPALSPVLESEQLMRPYDAPQMMSGSYPASEASNESSNSAVYSQPNNTAEPVMTSINETIVSYSGESEANVINETHYSDVQVEENAIEIVEVIEPPPMESAQFDVIETTTTTGVITSQFSDIKSGQQGEVTQRDYAPNSSTYEAGRRQVSSVIVSQELVKGAPSEMPIRYVEVPVIEEIIRRVPKRSVVEVEKIVPKYEFEVVDRIVEIPQIHYVDRQVDRPQVQEVIRNVPVKYFQDVPREVVKTVPKIEYVNVEKIVQVPGPVIEVPKPYVVENQVPVKRWVDQNLPVIVAQTIRPVIVKSDEVVDVDVYEYEPQVIQVDVQVAKPVASHMTSLGAVQEHHKMVTVPAAQYNSILRSMNMHLSDDNMQLPYIKDGLQIPFLGAHETPGVAAISEAQLMTSDIIVNQNHKITSNIMGREISTKINENQNDVIPTTHFIATSECGGVAYSPVGHNTFGHPLTQSRFGSVQGSSKSDVMSAGKTHRTHRTHKTHKSHKSHHHKSHQSIRPSMISPSMISPSMISPSMISPSMVSPSMATKKTRSCAC